MEDQKETAPGGQSTSSTRQPPPRINLSKYRICAAPKLREEDIERLSQGDPTKQLNLRKINELKYNPEFSELQKAEDREREDLKSLGKLIKKNTLTGYVEMTHLSEAQFEEQRRSFHFKGIAANAADIPGLEVKRTSVISTTHQIEQKCDQQVTQPDINITSFSSREKIKNNDPTDIDSYTGHAWATYQDEKHVSRPSEEDAAIIAEYRRKRHKPVQEEDNEQTSQEKAQLHIKNPYDYQGRSFLQAPRDLDGVNLYSDTSPEGCKIPRTLAHTFRGHSKAITATKYFPNTAHLILSSSLDGKVKLWEMYKERRCIMTYSGHKLGVRDICFNKDGDRFVSASYDKFIKLWDTETGQCIRRFTNNKMAYCVKFNPDPECAHMFLAGMSNKKILCWDCRTGEIVQEYDRHLGAISTITFVDENRKFISTSDDKSLRVWEWDIPVDVKYIADPTLHSMPAVTSARNNKRLLCQSMDNKIQAFTCHNKFKLDSKKIFKGHMVAGYACVPDFSCDMSLVISGDADGKIFFWSWSTTKIITNFKAHDNACISVMWHPHERQKLVSAGWDNLIKIWE